VIGRGDTPLAVRGGWVWENDYVCSGRWESSIVSVDDVDFWVLNVDSGRWRSHISFSVSWTLHCRRCSVEYWAILNVWTSLYTCLHTDVPTNETQLPRRPETSCWQRHSGHLPTRIRGTVTTRTGGRWERTCGVYCTQQDIMLQHGVRIRRQPCSSRDFSSLLRTAVRRPKLTAH